MKIHMCPWGGCNSTRVVRVRHDSDWGGINAQYLLNEEKYYNEEDIVEEFGDINAIYCYECDKYSSYTLVKVLE